jgi:transposase-like protein
MGIPKTSGSMNATTVPKMCPYCGSSEILLDPQGTGMRKYRWNCSQCEGIWECPAPGT